MLAQVCERGGGLELAIARDQGSGEPDAAAAPDLLWRVRLLGVRDAELLVESPAALGQSLPIRPGTDLVATFTVGQNRWMFRTRALRHAAPQSVGGRGPLVPASVLAAPEGVERCSRRSNLRVGTATLRLPMVQCWPLLDPASVVAAESVNRALLLERMNPSTGTAGPAGEEETPDAVLLPEVGPMFHAQLQNLSGGGLGLVVGPNEAANLDRHRYFWLRVDLRPDIPLPLAMTARRVHAHLDSGQNVHAGLAFDYAHNPQHQRFVSQLLERYLDHLESRQHRKAG